MAAGLLNPPDLVRIADGQGANAPVAGPIGVQELLHQVHALTRRLTPLKDEVPEFVTEAGCDGRIRCRNLWRVGARPRSVEDSYLVPVDAAFGEHVLRRRGQIMQLELGVLVRHFRLGYGLPAIQRESVPALVRLAWDTLDPDSVVAVVVVVVCHQD